MKLLIIVLVVAFVLLVLYLVARKVQPLGLALAFAATALSRIPAMLEEKLNGAADYCNKVCRASLRYPPGVRDGEYWEGINVLSRLVFFILAVCIGVGETVNTLIVLPALYQTGTHFALPGIVDVASAALFLCCPALFGAIIWECWGKIPHGAGLFPPMGKGSRWVLGVIAGLLLLFTILVNGYFYLFRAIYLADKVTALTMVPYILGGLGVEVATVAPFVLWALVVGGAGVVSLLMWVGEVVCRIGAFAASLVPHVLDVLAVHLSSGTMTVKYDFEEPGAYKVPPLTFPTASKVLPGQNTPAVLPQHAASIVDAEIVPVDTQEMEISPMNLEKSASFNCLGGFGQQMFTPVKQQVQELRAINNVMSTSYIVLPVNTMDTAIPGVIDMTPSLQKRHAASLHSNTQEEAYKTLFDDLADTLIETHINLKSVPAVLIFFMGFRELIETVDGLESIKRRYPLCKILVITEASSHDLQDKLTQVGIADLRALVSEDIVEVVMISDPNSALVSKYGLEIQHRFLAKLIVSLVIAYTHNDTNVAFSDALRALHSFCEFVMVSATSKPVAIGKVPNSLAWVLGVKGQVGTGLLTDILAQSRIAIDEVLTNEETAMFPVPREPGLFRIVVVNVPIQLDDKRFADCCAENALYVSMNYTNTLCLTVRGNGVAPLHHIGSRFLVQASCLTPILNPSSIFRAHNEPSVKIMQLHPSVPDTLATNGSVPAIGNKQVAKPAKAVSRQKKPAPSRRVIRKNTKQA